MDEDQLAELFQRQQMPDTSPATIPEPGVPMQDITVMAVEDNNPENPYDEGDVKMSDAEIQGILENHIRQSVTWFESAIAIEQAKAMEYYLGLQQGDLAPSGVAGRSSAMDTTVSDQIEWMMPALMEMFFASGDFVKYEPRKASDAPGAAQMTALTNYVVTTQNPGFTIFLDWFKSALLNKIGSIKVSWNPVTEEERTYYDNCTDEQLAVITEENDDLEIIKITSFVDPHAERAAMDQFKAQSQQYQQWLQAQAQAKAQGLPWPPMQPPPPGPPPQAQQPGMPPPPPMQPQPVQAPPKPQPIDLKKLPRLHNVIAKMSKKAGHVALDAMNPEDFIFDAKSRRVEDGFSAHRLRRTVSYLKARGYKNVDQITSNSDAQSQQYNEVQLAREQLQNTYMPSNAEEDYGDESMREVWLFECYLPIDCDLDGIAEWRKITVAGNQILENVMVDDCPFATLCPVPIPGMMVGRSIADLGMQTQFAKTGVLRSLIDNMNVQINGRTWAIESQVNISDLLTNRPGGVVRVKSAQAVGPITQGMADSQGAYQLLEYLDTQAQERSGVTKYTQGSDADSLNKTATGYTGITQRADMRVNLIARIFGESGIKRMCMLIQKELARHQDQTMAIQVNDDWVDIDPRVWHSQYIIKPNVGLGTGDRQKKVQQILQLMGVQTQAAAVGLVTPENAFNTACDLVEAIQLGKPSRYFTPVGAPGNPQKQPPPDPQMVLVQGQLAIEQQKANDKKELDGINAMVSSQQADRDFEHKKYLAEEKMKMEDGWKQQEFHLKQQQYDWDKKKTVMMLESQREVGALRANATTAMEATMRAQTIADNKEVAMKSLHVDSAHQDADRQHEADQNQAQRDHDAQQAELDREAQAAQAQQQGTTE